MVIDSDDRPVAVIEVTGLCVVPLAQVDLAHVVDEGERGHQRGRVARRSRAVLAQRGDACGLGDPDFTVDDTTLAVLERFRLITDLRPSN